MSRVRVSARVRFEGRAEQRAHARGRGATHIRGETDTACKLQATSMSSGGLSGLSTT